MKSFINYINFRSISCDELISLIITNINNNNINDSVANENEENEQQNINLNNDDYLKYILCLTLLNHICVTLTNEKFQKS